jgi:RecB family exonuclease
MSKALTTGALRGEVLDPEEPLRLSNSKAKTWRRCPNQFRYKYELGLRTRDRSIYLERGTWLHTLMEVYYSADPTLKIKVGKRWYEVGQDWRKAHKLLARGFNSLFDEEKEDLGDLPTECLRIFTSYLMRYGKQDAKNWKVIDAELNEIVTLPSGLRFQVIIDLIVEEPDGGLWIVDHKTVGRFMPVDFMLLDAQLARYFWCA